MTGKIYKIINNRDNLIYVGSTITSLRKRFNSHKHTSKTHGHMKVYRHFNAIQWVNVSIQLIEEVKDADNLASREQHYIELLQPQLNERSARAICQHLNMRYTCVQCPNVICHICETSYTCFRYYKAHLKKNSHIENFILY